jgi:CubicO group peptidase (beta-lactamase class C family)
MLDASGKKDKKLTASSWRAANFFRPFTDGYGYQWWLDKDGSYSAVGVGGQYIMVVPQQNLVVTFTSSSSRLGVFFPRKILDKFILPSVVSDEAIPPNKIAFKELTDRSGPPELAMVPIPITPLPGIAMEISGKTYSLESNYFKFDNYQLVFDTNQDYAQFSYTQEGDSASFQVGLDGVYRFSKTDSGQFAAFGSWISENTFDFTFIQIGYSSETRFVLTFEDDTITIEEYGVVGETKYQGHIIK